MQKEKNVGDRNLSRMIGILTGLLLLLMAISPRTHAQQVAGSAADKELTVTDLLKLPGKVLAKGKNTSPVGQFKLLNYRVEELALPRSMKVELNGQQVEVNKAWRVTVTGGPFPVRALPAVIWIDDQIVGYGVENDRLSAITAITFDPSLLRDGAAISLSYGEEKEGRARLPEKLNLSSAH